MPHLKLVQGATGGFFFMMLLYLCLYPLNQKAPASLSLLEKLFTHPELHVPASRNNFLGYLTVAARHAAMIIFAACLGLSAFEMLIKQGK